MKRLEKILWWCAGAHLPVLEDCKTDQSKYFGIGGTILFTALMASFAGGYAFFTAFDHVFLSCFFGLFWGALIFNLDRYIVSSTQKREGQSSWRVWRNALPRLVLAVLLGFVISTPLELKIFESEIEAEIAENIERSKLTAQTQIEERYSRIPMLQAEMDTLRKEVSSKYRERQMAEQAYLAEITGEVQHGGSGLRGIGEIAAEKKDFRDQLESEYQVLKAANATKIEALQKDKEQWINRKQRDVNERENVEERSKGLLARLEALANITRERPALLMAKWMITLLFIFIEIAPILFKMMTDNGPYEDKLELIRKKSKMYAAQEIQDLERRMGLRKSIALAKISEQSNYEKGTDQKLARNMADARLEVYSNAIHNWKQGQLEKTGKDPESFIKKVSEEVEV